MDKDFKERAIVAYFAFTIGLPLMALGMKANGGAYPGNPAWTLISTLRWIALGILALTILGGLLYGWSELMSNPKPSPQKRTPTRELSPPSPEELEALRIVNERRRAEHEEWERKEAARREQERWERERAKLEEEGRRLREKRTRSFAAAVETALEEF